MTRVHTFAIPGRAPASEPLTYTAAGLDGIVLINGFEHVETDYGPGVKVENVDGLLKAIGISIALDRTPLAPREFRFLRKLLDKTQEDLARLLKLDVQTVARYEKGQYPIPFAAQWLLKVHFVLSQVPTEVQLEVLQSLVDDLRAPTQPSGRVLDRASTGWETRVAP